jgi:O-antigen/teichoic acid export membrane protein
LLITISEKLRDNRKLIQLFEWFNDNRTIILNAASMVGTSGVTSLLGFVFWWIAARLFTPAQVGFASAGISTMMLLSEFSLIGLGTLLVGYLPKNPQRAGPLILSALIIAGTIGMAVGVIFALGAPYISQELSDIAQSVVDICLYGSGVALTSMGLIADQATIGMLRGELQLTRNIIFSSAKLILVAIGGLLIVYATGMTIYGAWALGALLSLLALLGIIARKNYTVFSLRPDWRMFQLMGRSAIEHHALNLMVQVSTLAMPLIVTAILSVEAAGSYYLAFMLAGVTSIATNALATVLYAVGSGAPDKLAEKLRLTLRLSFLAAFGAMLILEVGARPILSLFGSTYADRMFWPLRILPLSTFPAIIRFHYVALKRIYNQLGRTALLMLVLGALELASAAIGAVLADLAGLTIGLLIATIVEAMIMYPTVHRALKGKFVPRIESTLADG